MITKKDEWTVLKCDEGNRNKCYLCWYYETCQYAQKPPAIGVLLIMFIIIVVVGLFIIPRII